MRAKKILSLAVVLAMVLTVMPMFGLTASAAELELNSTVMIDGLKYKINSENKFPAFTDWTSGTGTGSWGSGSNVIPKHDTVAKIDGSWTTNNDATVGDYITESYGLSTDCGWNMNRAPLIFVEIDPNKTYYFVMKYKNQTTDTMFVRYGAINENSYTDDGGVNGQITFSGTGFRNNTTSHTNGATMPGTGDAWVEETSIIKPGPEANYFIFNDAWMDSQVHSFAQMGLYEVVPVETDATITVKYTDNGQEIGTEEIPYYQGEKYTLSLGKYRLSSDGSLYQLSNGSENKREIEVNSDTVGTEVKVVDKVKNVGGANLVTGGEFNEKNDTLGHNLTFFKVANDNTLENINNSNGWPGEEKAGLGYERSFQTTVPVDAGKKYFYSIDIYSTGADGLWASCVFNKTTEPLKSQALNYAEQVDASEGTQTNISASGTATGTQLTAGNENKWYTISGIVEATESDKMFEFDVYYMHDCPGSKIDNVKFYEVEDIPANVTVNFVDDDSQKINVDPVTVESFVGAKVEYDLPLILTGKNKENYVRSADQARKIVIDFVKDGASVNAKYKKDIIVSADPIEVTTRENVRPVLPTTVTAKLQSGGTIDAEVEWEELDPSKFAEAGSATVTGKITDEVSVTANVEIKAMDDYLVASYGFEGNGDNSASEENKYPVKYGSYVTIDDNGLFGKAASFSGNDSNTFDQDKDMYIDGDLLKDSRFANDEITVSAFVKRSNKDDWGRLFDFGNATDGNDIFYGVYYGKFKFQGGDGFDFSNASVPADEWHNITLTYAYNGKVAAIYYDGKLVKENVGKGYPLSNVANAENVKYLIGTSNWADPRYNGLMDNFKIYSVALTADEINIIGGIHEITVKYVSGEDEVAIGKISGYNGQIVELPATVKKNATIYDVSEKTVTIDSDTPNVAVQVTPSTTVVKSAPQDIKAKYIYNAENPNAASALPKTVQVTYTDDSTSEVNVTWAETTVDADPDTIVTKSDIIGTIEGTDITAKASVDVYPADTYVATPSGDTFRTLDNSYNGIMNADFDMIINQIGSGADNNPGTNVTISLGNPDKGSIQFGWGGDAISIQVGDNVNLRTWNEGSGTYQFQEVPTIGEIYHVSIVANVPEQTYNVKITDSKGDTFAEADATFRNADIGEIKRLLVYNYNRTTDDTVRIFNIDIKGSNVPTLTPALGWNDGKFTIDYVASDVVNELNAEYAVTVTSTAGAELTGDGKFDPATSAGVGFAPADTNDTFTAKAVVTVGDETLESAATAATGIYGLVMDAIANSELNGLINAEQLEVVNEVLKNGNILLTADENGALKLTDAAAKVMKLEGNTITLTEKAVQLGLKFTDIGAGTDAASAPTAATVSEDGKSITLPEGVTTAEAMVLALESVQLEFVPTEIAESDGDGADAVQDFIPEL